MLFDKGHVLYMAISAAITAGLLTLAGIFVKKQTHKNLILKTAAITTFVLHHSNIWVEFFTNGGSTAGLEASHLLPMYPCHIMMWVLLIVSLMRNHEGKVFTVLAEFCFWAGIVCGTLGIVLNENYASNPDFTDWYILKGMASHSTMVFGSIYLLVGKFIKIRVFNVVSVAIGLIGFIVEGAFVNGLYALCGLPEVNAMYLLYSPYPSMPWLSPIMMGAVAVVLLFGALALYEYLHFPVEERWYTKLKNRKKKKRDVTKEDVK